jgi:fructose transport system substrate-binding protein
MRHSHGDDQSRRRHRRLAVLAVLLVVVVTAAVVSAASATTTSKSATVKVGLITKDATNPFFVKMHAGADAAAKKADAQLMYAAGKDSSDNAGQITAIENMVSAGVKGILITVADAKAENAAIA